VVQSVAGKRLTYKSLIGENESGGTHDASNVENGSVDWC
jgi:hypothetical protein